MPSISADAPTAEPSEMPSISADAPTADPSEMPSSTADAPTLEPSFTPAPATDDGGAGFETTSPTPGEPTPAPSPAVPTMFPTNPTATPSSSAPSLAPTETNNPDTVKESAALCDYYDSLPAAGKAQLTNWCGGRDASGLFVNGTCSEDGGAWLGVTCSKKNAASFNRVTDFNLDNLPLGGGRIPTSIGNLEAMTFLRLSNTGLTGSIPIQLGKISNLEQLWLGGNPGLTGSVPSQLVRKPGHGKFPALTVLHLSSTGITGAIPESFCLLDQAKIDLRILDENDGITCIPQCMNVAANWPFMRLDPDIANVCSPSPTPLPGFNPTELPTVEPTQDPTIVPTQSPTTSTPSNFPTFEPTSDGPTLTPSARPSRRPTDFPTEWPSAEPTTLRPTRHPSAWPSAPSPTPQPSETPTWAPFVQFGDEIVLCNYFKSLPRSGQLELTNWCGNRTASTGDYSPPACSPKDSQFFGLNVWRGVTCCISGGRDRVCDVNLANIQLGPGTIPQNIGNLDALTYLNLMSTGLAGTVPNSLSTISAMQQIWLSGNPKLTGPLPSLGSPVLLDKLRNLHLSKTSLGFSYTGGSRVQTRLPSSLCNLTTGVTLRTINDPGFVCYPKCLSAFINFVPDKVPVCAAPTTQPTEWPSFEPTLRPSHRPSRQPSLFPTTEPTNAPSRWPSHRPSEPPSAEPSLAPTSAVPTSASQFSDEAILCQFFATLPVGNAASTGVKAYGQGALANWCQGKDSQNNYSPTVCSRDGSGKDAWTGVTCCYTVVGKALVDRVCDINLFAHNLGPGRLPGNIGGLDALTYLNLRQTGIAGPWPEQLGSIGGMQQVWLSDNAAFNGSIPADFGSQAPIKALSMLHLTRTALSGPMPSAMCQLGPGSGSSGRSLDLRTQWSAQLGCYPPCLQPGDIFFNFRPAAQQSECSPPSALPTLSPTSGPSLRPSKVPTTEPTFEPTNRPTRLPTHQPTTVSAQSDGDVLCCYYATMDPVERLRLKNWCGPKKDGSYITGPCSDAGWMGVTCQRPSPEAPERVTDLNLPDFGPLQGYLPSCIGGLNALTYLNVRQTRLSKSLPEQLGNLLDLQQLWVGDNPVTGSLPSSLGKLTNLKTLFLSNTAITGSVPATLCSLPYKMFDLRILGNSGLQCYPSCLLASRVFRRELPWVLPTCDSPAPSAEPTARSTDAPTPEPTATATEPPTRIVRVRVTPVPVPQSPSSTSSPSSSSPDGSTTPTPSSSDSADAPTAEPSGMPSISATRFKPSRDTDDRRAGFETTSPTPGVTPSPSSSSSDSSAQPSSSAVADSSAQPSSSAVADTLAPSSSAVADSSAPSSSAVADTSAPSSSAVADSSAPSSSAVADSSAPSSSAVADSSAPSSSAVADSSAPSSSAVADSSAPSSSAVADTSAPSSSAVAGSSAPSSSAVADSSAQPSSSAVADSSAPSSSAVADSSAQPSSSTVADTSAPSSSSPTSVPTLAPSPFSFSVNLPTLPVFTAASPPTVPPTRRPAPTRRAPRTDSPSAAPSVSSDGAATGTPSISFFSPPSATEPPTPSPTPSPTEPTDSAQSQTPTMALPQAQAASSGAAAAASSSSQTNIYIGVGAAVLVVIFAVVAYFAWSAVYGRRTKSVSQLLAAAKSDSSHPSTSRTSSFMHHDVYNPFQSAPFPSLEMSSPSSRAQSSQRPSSRLPQRHLSAGPQMANMGRSPERSLSPGVRGSTRL